MKLKQALIFIFLVYLFSFNIYAKELPLIVDGISNAIIVLAKEPSKAANLGARILSEHLTQISNTKVDTFYEDELGEVNLKDGYIYTDKYDDSFSFILVGESSVTKKLGVSVDHLGAGGILVETKGNALILVGPDDKTPTDPHGTQYAVTTFLQEQLGVFYLWPGELGKVVPKSKTITVSEIKKSYTPPIKHRRIRFYNGINNPTMKRGRASLGIANNDYLQIVEEASSTISFDDSWLKWNRLGGDLGLKSGHAFTKFHSQYWEKHPEWFALQPDGTRNQVPPFSDSKFCLTNTQVLEQIAHDKITEIRKNPSLASVSVSLNDGNWNKFCMCDNCKALDPVGEDSSYSDRVIWFANQIAEKVVSVYPDILIITDAYGNYTNAPVKNDVHPNLVVRYVGFSRWYEFGDPYGKRSIEVWDEWAEKSANLFWRPNLLFYSRYEGSLGVVAKNLSQTFNHFSRSGIVALDFDAPFFDDTLANWSTHGLNIYILSRLCWEPDLNVEKAINEYCRAGFGDGWQYIKQYFERVEELGIQNFIDFSDYCSLIYDEDIIKELDELLDKASLKVKMGTNYNDSIDKRIEFLRVGLNWTALQGKIYRGIQKMNSGQEFDYDQLLDLLDKRFETMQNLLVEHPLAINVLYIQGE